MLKQLKNNVVTRGISSIRQKEWQVLTLTLMALVFSIRHLYAAGSFQHDYIQSGVVNNVIISDGEDNYLEKLLAVEISKEIEINESKVESEKIEVQPFFIFYFPYTEITSKTVHKYLEPRSGIFMIPVNQYTVPLFILYHSWKSDLA